MAEPTPRGAAGQQRGQQAQQPKVQNVKIQIPETLIAQMAARGGPMPPPGAGQQAPSNAAMLRAMLERRAAMQGQQGVPTAAA